MDERRVERRTSFRHLPGVHKDGDKDLVHRHQVTTDTAHPTYLQITEMQQASVWVTSEFMSDAAGDPLLFVADRLDDAARRD